MEKYKEVCQNCHYFWNSKDTCNLGDKRAFSHFTGCTNFQPNEFLQDNEKEAQNG